MNNKRNPSHLRVILPTVVKKRQTQSFPEAIDGSNDGDGSGGNNDSNDKLSRDIGTAGDQCGAWGVNTNIH